jgi:hypothetical protein
LMRTFCFGPFVLAVSRLPVVDHVILSASSSY